VRRALRVAQECSRKTYAESASNARGYGNSGRIQTIFDDLSLPLRGLSRTLTQASMISSQTRRKRRSACAA
jgi:hypothetical protein